MKASIIISYYKAISNLKLILDALSNQSANDFEVIISEDDANTDTITSIEEFRSIYHFNIKHTNQKTDNGFRKNEMLNKSILAAEAPLIIFIDGDCIPHPEFVKNYIGAFNDQLILAGRKVNLGPKFSKKLMETQDIDILQWQKLILTDTQQVKEGIYSPQAPINFSEVKSVVGCNWGVAKEALLDVNGFDENYTAPGIGEDTDIEWRLKQNGLTIKSMKNKAIVFHIYHKRTYTNEMVKKNRDILNQTKASHQVVCLNGIEKLPL